MSTYINNGASGFGGAIKGQPRGTVKYLDDPHDWQEFTSKRLRWLYGPNHAEERQAKTQADLAAWNALGQQKGRAA